jgi:hypothetical protein
MDPMPSGGGRDSAVPGPVVAEGTLDIENSKFNPVADCVIAGRPIVLVCRREGAPMPSPPAGWCDLIHDVKNPERGHAPSVQEPRRRRPEWVARFEQNKNIQRPRQPESPP